MDKDKQQSNYTTGGHPAGAPREELQERQIDQRPTREAIKAQADHRAHQGGQGNQQEVDLEKAEHGG